MQYFTVDGYHIFNSIDELVPNGHLIRPIENYTDWAFIYSLYEDLSEEESDDQWIDIVTLFKMIIIDIIFNINSIQNTCIEIEVNVAYRWFLGCLIDEQTPSFSTFIYNYRKQFTNKEIMIEILMKILTSLDCDEVIDLSKILKKSNLLIQKDNQNINENDIKNALTLYLNSLNQEINIDQDSH